MSALLKIMSFNIRIENNKDGCNSFTNRKERILNMIREQAPDIIGIQEASRGVRDWLKEVLTGYTVYGCGRGADYNGEGIPVAVKNGAMELVELQSKWLSDTPDVPGSHFTCGGHSRYSRMYIKMKLKHKDSDNLLIFVNTHTDHQGAEARIREEKALIQDLCADAGAPMIVTGDFNALPETPEIRYMTSPENPLGFADATEGLGGTFHNFGRYPEAIKIDYIFTNLEFENSYVVDDIPVNGVFLSDHRPVCSDIIIR